MLVTLWLCDSHCPTPSIVYVYGISCFNISLFLSLSIYYLHFCHYFTNTIFLFSLSIINSFCHVFNNDVNPNFVSTYTLSFYLTNFIAEINLIRIVVDYMIWSLNYFFFNVLFLFLFLIIKLYCWWVKLAYEAFGAL